MIHPVRFGVKVSGQDVSAEDLQAVWRIADESGLDHLWCFDHFASVGDGGTDRPVYEGWALQAAMAVATHRVRFGCMVTGNTFRSPWQLAKLAVTVDHLSGGRLEFGIGAGWAEAEHGMYDIAGLAHRVGMLLESLRILKELWTNDRVSFEGRYYTLRDAIANPKPVQQPYPPIWIGAGRDQMLRVVARHADVWSVASSAMEHVTDAIATVEDSCERIGRDPSTLRRSIHVTWDGKDGSALIDACSQRLEQGFTEVVIYLAGSDAVANARALADMLGDLRELESRQ